MPTLAGPEIGVASTKAFTCQLATLACLAVAAGRARGILSETDEHNLFRALVEVPRLMAEALALEPAIEKLARDLASSKDVLYLGPRHELPAGAGRRAQAQGDLLHPRRGLRGRRAQARADRADRRDHAGDRDRALRPGLRQDRLQHGGGRRPRRPHHPGHRPEGGRACHGEDLATLILPEMAATVTPLGLRDPGPAARLSHGGHHGDRRGPAAQPRQVGDRRVAAAKCVAVASERTLYCGVGRRIPNWGRNGARA